MRIPYLDPHNEREVKSLFQSSSSGGVQSSAQGWSTEGKNRGFSMTRAALFGTVAAALMVAATSSAFADDISRDLRNIRHDRADIYRDRVKLREELAERNYDSRREWRAIQHGNFGAAQYWDARRR